MAHRLCTITTFLTAEEAEFARMVLAEAGIPSFLECAATIGMVWIWSNAIGGVKLQVAEEDVEHAIEVLKQTATTSSDATKSPCICPNCHAENPADFDVCWSCQQPIKENDRDAAPASTVSLPVTEGERSDTEACLEEVNRADALAWRAFVVAVLGIVCCPPFLPVFSLYSAYLLVRVSLIDQELSPSGKRYCRWATVLNLAFCLLGGLFFFPFI